MSVTVVPRGNPTSEYRLQIQVFYSKDLYICVYTKTYSFNSSFDIKNYKPSTNSIVNFTKSDIQ